MLRFHSGHPHLFVKVSAVNNWTQFPGKYLLRSSFCLKKDSITSVLLGISQNDLEQLFSRKHGNSFYWNSAGLSNYFYISTIYLTIYSIQLFIYIFMWVFQIFSGKLFCRALVNDRYQNRKRNTTEENHFTHTACP